MYKICSWDVGIKNLAFCVLTKKKDNKEPKFEIEKWDIINLIKDEIFKCELCDKKSTATMTFEGKVYNYCTIHKKQCKKLDDDWEYKYIQKVLEKNICKNEKCTKNAYYKCKDDTHVCAIHKKQYLNNIKKSSTLIKIKKNKCKNYSSFDICKKLYEKLDSLPYLLQLDEILIENQPSFLNPISKSVASYLFGYFMMKGILGKNETNSTIKNVRYISPSNKLKVNENKTLEVLSSQEAKKNKYKLTKSLSIKYTKILLNECVWLSHLNKYPKKDDLCDAYLQGYHYMQYKLK